MHEKKLRACRLNKNDTPLSTSAAAGSRARSVVGLPNIGLRGGGLFLNHDRLQSRTSSLDKNIMWTACTPLDYSSKYCGWVKNRIVQIFL